MPKGKGSGSAAAWRVVFVVAVVVFVCSVVALGVIAYSYLQGQQKYAGIAQQAGMDASDLPGNEPSAQVEYPSINWDELKAMNPDVVAWVYIPGTAINYPVVQGADNEYYLTHDFSGEQGWLANYGSVFLDFRNDPLWADELSFLYGHHMNDGSMFSDIISLADQGRFDECRTVYVLSPTANWKLATFALVHVGAEDAIVQTGFVSPEEREAYVNAVIAGSVVNAGSIVPVAEMGHLFAFSTCDNQAAEGRYILYAHTLERM